VLPRNVALAGGGRVFGSGKPGLVTLGAGLFEILDLTPKDLA
jgi:hypothetical protein